MLRKLLGQVKDAQSQDSDTQDTQPLGTQSIVSF